MVDENLKIEKDFQGQEKEMYKLLEERRQEKEDKKKANRLKYDPLLSKDKMKERQDAKMDEIMEKASGKMFDIFEGFGIQTEQSLSQSKSVN